MSSSPLGCDFVTSLFTAIHRSRFENKVHRVLEFNQSPWLKEYIDFNTQKGTQVKNSFKKDFFKPMNNSVFGKAIENLRKRVNVKLVTDDKKHQNQFL